MSVPTVITLGYGSFSTVNFLPTIGYGDFAAPDSPPDSPPDSQPNDYIVYARRHNIR